MRVWPRQGSSTILKKIHMEPTLVCHFAVCEATVPIVCLLINCGRDRIQWVWSIIGEWRSSATAARMTVYATTISARGRWSGALIALRRSYINMMDNDNYAFIYIYIYMNTYLFLARIILTGVKRPLTYDDVWDVRPNDSSHVIYSKFTRYWNPGSKYGTNSFICLYKYDMLLPMHKGKKTFRANGLSEGH